LGKSGVATGIAYVSGGTIPAVAVLGSSMAYDELMPEQKSVDQIQSKEQATAYIAESLFMNLLYGGIAYMLITFLAVPFIRRWGYNQAKAKYKVNNDL